MRVITTDDIRNLIRKVTLEKFIKLLVEELRLAFEHWQDFRTIPRTASYFKHGVIELMPIFNDQWYTYKYVNGHPGNPALNKLTVVAIGMLADIKSGYPICISEMTLLTALRTAATSALASSLLAKKKSQIFAMIGTGAQSEFQVLTHAVALGIKRIQYFDIDPHAMKKFAKNLQKFSLELFPCTSLEKAIENADIITLATADKKNARLIQKKDLRPGLFINGIGGDSPGKTELDPEVLKASKIVVELLEQTKIEGEIQNVPNMPVYAELWEIVQGKKPGRQNDQEIFVFDSVGFALEDFAALKLVNRLAEEFHVGHMLDLIPELDDPKDLFSVLRL